MNGAGAFTYAVTACGPVRLHSPYGPTVITDALLEGALEDQPAEGIERGGHLSAEAAHRQVPQPEDDRDPTPSDAG